MNTTEHGNLRRLLTDRATGRRVLRILNDAIRAGVRMIRAAATTVLDVARHLYPEPLTTADGHPLLTGPLTPAADLRRDANRTATIAAVLDNPARDRFDLWVGDELVGVLGYLNEHDITAQEPSDRRGVAFMHTIIAEDWARQGLAAFLVREAYDHARTRNWTVRLVCSYAQSLTLDHQAHEVASASPGGF
ncbi:GNAT family N-acetyltransferase [Rhodococcus jostii]|uniref:GNAT family N-acetyltransferase n=1 Tax=Rhodococcus jostii TaxID=132919 RepID=UPI00364B743B